MSFRRGLLLGCACGICVAALLFGLFLYVGMAGRPEESAATLLPHANMPHLLERKIGPIGVIGHEHIFYFVYCGSSCKGLQLVNLTTGAVKQGSLGFFSDDEGNDYTLFDDWLHREYRFEGFVDDTASHTEEDISWLVFRVLDESGVTLHEYRVKYTEAELP